MAPRVVVALLLLSACSTTGADGDPGFETGPCVDGGCFDELQCLSDLCVMAEESEADEGGGFVGGGPSDSATSSSMTTEPGDSSSTPESATTPATSLTGAETSDVTTNADSADEAPSDDDSTTTGTTGWNQCGNGEIDPGEQCDGDDVQGFDCAGLGLGVGDISCDPIVCSFDTSMCMATSSGTSG